MIQEEFNPQHNLMVAKSDWRQQLIKFEPVANYQLYDIIFDIYRSGRYGHYLVRKAFYTVFEIKLNKAVPQLIFDAKQGKGQQFKLLYAQSQRLSFGGHLYTKSQTTSQDADFNDLFMAYSPMHHAVETYSFITPEVIEAILELQHYDLEFLDDRLFCYAPLLDKPTLAKFERQCLNLYAKVNDNLRVYTASIPEKSPMSRRLLGSPWKHLPLTAMSGVGLILFLFLLVTHDFTEGWGDAIEPMIFSDLCGLGFLLGIIQIISTFKHNRTTTKKLLEAQTKSQQPPP